MPSERLRKELALYQPLEEEVAFTQKDNTGALFKNEDRSEDTHPNAKGSCTIEGVEYWLSAWTKEGKSGKFQSLTFKRKKPKNDEDSDVPF